MCFKPINLFNERVINTVTYQHKAYLQHRVCYIYFMNERYNVKCILPPSVLSIKYAYLYAWYDRYEYLSFMRAVYSCSILSLFTRVDRKMFIIPNK